MIFWIATAALATLSGIAIAQDAATSRPIMLAKSGGFQIGGKIIHDPTNSSRTLSCDHGYVEYFHPYTPRKTSLVMWHSSSTQVWQNRWDGGEGYKDMFLRRDYPVYLWDGPRVGRANWACVPIVYVPNYGDQGNFVAWKFGDKYPEWYDGVQFPTQDKEAWQQATSARYQEFDTVDNVELHSDVMAIAADSGKLGNNIVYLTNSAGGLRAMMSTTKSNKNNIKGIVTYESIGYVFPDNVNITKWTSPGGGIFPPPPGNGTFPPFPPNGTFPPPPGNGTCSGFPAPGSGTIPSFPSPPKWNGTGGFSAFGPFVVPLEKFKKLAKLTSVQFVWGDHRPESDPYVAQSREVASLINKYGGNARVLKLAEDAGLTGSTHIAFADMDNSKLAGLLDEYLEKGGLDEYVDDKAVQRRKEAFGF